MVNSDAIGLFFSEVKTAEKMLKDRRKMVHSDGI